MKAEYVKSVKSSTITFTQCRPRTPSIDYQYLTWRTGYRIDCFVNLARWWTAAIKDALASLARYVWWASRVFEIVATRTPAAIRSTDQATSVSWSVSGRRWLHHRRLSLQCLWRLWWNMVDKTSDTTPLATSSPFAWVPTVWLPCATSFDPVAKSSLLFTSRRSFDNRDIARRGSSPHWLFAGLDCRHRLSNFQSQRV